MKRIVGLVLIAVFIIAVSGCAPKSEYDKLMAEKSRLDVKYNELSTAKVKIDAEIVGKLKDIKTLKDDLGKANGTINDLKRELGKANARVKSLEEELKKLKIQQ